MTMMKDDEATFLLEEDGTPVEVRQTPTNKPPGAPKGGFALQAFHYFARATDDPPGHWRALGMFLSEEFMALKTKQELDEKFPVTFKP